jgi:hypothetical protein
MKIGDKRTIISFAWFPEKLTNGQWIWFKSYQENQIFMEYEQYNNYSSYHYMYRIPEEKGKIQSWVTIEKLLSM